MTLSALNTVAFACTNDEITMLHGVELHQAVDALINSWTSFAHRHHAGACAHFAVRNPASLATAFSTIRHHNVVPDEAIYTALALVRRVMVKNADVVLTPANAVTIFLTALLVAGKIWLDVPYNTVSFGMLAGVNARTMFQFETKLLNLLDWEVIVAPDEIALIARALASGSGNGV